MMQLVHKHRLVFFIFLFLVSISYVNGYSAGEKLNISYGNITEVTAPCYLFNDSIYIRGDIKLGDNECNITYKDYSNDSNEESSGSGSSGGSSGGSSAKYNCSGWSECINKKQTRNCNIGVTKYSQTISCVPKPITVAAPAAPVVEPVKEEPKQEPIPIIEVEEEINLTNAEPTKQKNNLFKPIGIILIIICVLIFFYFLLKKINKSEEVY